MRLMGVDTTEEATVFSLHCFSGTSVSSIGITNRKIAGKEEMQFVEPPASQNWIDTVDNNCLHKLITLNLRARVYQKDLLEEANSAIISVCSIMKREHFLYPPYMFMHLKEHCNKSKFTYKMQ